MQGLDETSLTLNVPSHIYSQLSSLPLEGDEVWGLASSKGVKVLGRVRAESIDIGKIFEGSVEVLFIFHTHTPPSLPFPSPVDIETAERFPLIYAIVGLLHGIKVVTFYSPDPFTIRDSRIVRSSKSGRIHLVVRPLNRLIRFLHPSPLTRLAARLL